MYHAHQPADLLPYHHFAQPHQEPSLKPQQAQSQRVQQLRCQSPQQSRQQQSPQQSRPQSPQSLRYKSSPTLIDQIAERKQAKKQEQLQTQQRRSSSPPAPNTAPRRLVRVEEEYCRTTCYERGARPQLTLSRLTSPNEIVRPAPRRPRVSFSEPPAPSLRRPSRINSPAQAHSSTQSRLSTPSPPRWLSTPLPSNKMDVSAANHTSTSWTATPLSPSTTLYRRLRCTTSSPKGLAADFDFCGPTSAPRHAISCTSTDSTLDARMSSGSEPSTSLVEEWSSETARLRGRVGRWCVARVLKAAVGHNACFECGCSLERVAGRREGSVPVLCCEGGQEGRFERAVGWSAEGVRMESRAKVEDGGRKLVRNCCDAGSARAEVFAVLHDLVCGCGGLGERKKWRIGPCRR